MKNATQAYIRWLSPEEGGRSSIPSILHHVLVSRFAENTSVWPREAWSLVVDFQEPPSSDRFILADIRFLVDEGPVVLFHSGSRFELLDGYKVVAQGEVI